VAQHGNAMAEVTPVAPGDQAEEYLMMALRLAEGADLDRFARLAGAALDTARVENLVALDLLRVDGTRLMATPAGRMVLNRVLAELLAG